MRDGAQQVGAQLLVFGEHRRLLAGFHGAGAVERQLAFAHDGIGQHPFFVRQRVGVGNDGEHAHHRGGLACAHHGVTRAHRQINAVERRAAKRGVKRRSHVGRSREQRRHLGRQLMYRRGIAHSGIRHVRQQVIALFIGAVPHARAARKARELGGRSVHDLLLIGTALQHTVGLEHHLRATVAGRGLRQRTAQRQGDGARHERDQKHDYEHAGIDAVDKRQRIPGVDKQKVVERHGGGRREQAVQAAPGKKRAQLHGKHVDDHNARGNSGVVEQRANNRRRQQQPRRDAKIVQGAAPRQRRASPPKAIGKIAIHPSVHAHRALPQNKNHHEGDSELHPETWTE